MLFPIELWTYNITISKIVNTILEFAVKSRASDIHIEPTATNTLIRFRIDGILHDVGVLPKSIHAVTAKGFEIKVALCRPWEHYKKGIYYGNPAREQEEGKDRGPFITPERQQVRQ